MTTNDIPKLRCHDACGAEVDDEDKALMAGWSYLQALRAWRCPKCARELLAASSMAGTPPVEGPDPLPPHSLGALKKETASSILPPTVRPE